MPGEARWSRSSSIILSVVVHLALFILISRMLWKPDAEKSGPVFNVFQLDAPKEKPHPIALPPVAQPLKKDIAHTTPDAPNARPAQPAVQNPQISEPTQVPSTLPPPGAATPEPSLTPSHGPPSAAQRILGTALDPGLMPDPPSNDVPMVTPQEAAAARLANGIRQINDSIAAAIAAENGATDWTKTDRNGNKWGVSPGKLHLGSITLPLPIYFAPPPGRRDDVMRSVRSYSESNAQAKRVDMEETFETRVKAMRARKNAARDSARAAIGH